MNDSIKKIPQTVVVLSHKVIPYQDSPNLVEVPKRRQSSEQLLVDSAIKS